MWTARVLFGKVVRLLSQRLSKYREKLGKWMGLSSNTDILRSRLVSFWTSCYINISHELERFVVALYNLLFGLPRIWSNSAVFYKVGSTHMYVCMYIYIYGPGSSVGIATELRTRRSGIESRSGRDFPPSQTGPWAHPASCTMGIGSFPWVKCGRDVLLTTHPLLVPRSWKSRAIPLPILWATLGL